MKKIFQNEWHKISFKTFAKLSADRLPSVSFYSEFYKKFFEKYKNLDELDIEWLKLKQKTADFISNHEKASIKTKILSIGCGVGVIEKSLIDAGYENLEITEVSEHPLFWISHYLKKDKMHVGVFPECVDENKKYELIYMSDVEYFFNEKQLVEFLKCVKDRLLPNGICLLLTVAIEREYSFVKNIAKYFKGVLLLFLVVIKLKKQHEQQFWGYVRTGSDLKKTMELAGFAEIRDGYLEKSTKWDTYWIKGTKT
jgi:2-polyprenyl-3-methyl-5-hydroxy-6-metoxy-1,4-benzoquinol methylase